MTNRALLCTGVTGTVITALCCFTPILVIAFGAAGLSAWVGYVDFVLLPALAFFIGLTAYALFTRYRSSHSSKRSTPGPL